MIKVVIDSVKKSVTVDPAARIILLKDDHDRYLPIWTGWCEGDTLVLKLSGQKLKEPLSFDYLRQMLQLSNLEVEKVHIHSMKENVYFACVIATRRSLFRSERIEIDCRPSDGILVATYFERPIFVADELMDKYSVRPEQLPSTQNPSAPSAAPVSNDKPFDPYADFWENFVNIE